MDSSLDISSDVLDVSDVDSSIYQKQLTPRKRKLKHIEDDLDGGDNHNNENVFENTPNKNRSKNESKPVIDTSQHEPRECFQSQNLWLSQLTQGSVQNGKFTYFQKNFWISPATKNDFNILSPNELNSIREKHIDRLNSARTFFLTLQSVGKDYDLIIDTMEIAAPFFMFPEQNAIIFLRQFINFYPDLTQSDSISMTVLDGYIRIMENIFMNPLSSKKSLWNRDHLLSLFKSPDSKTANIANEHTFIFDLIEYHIQHLDKFTELKHKSQQFEQNDSYALLLSSQMFHLMVNFLQKDFEKFFQQSSNYFQDISNIQCLEMKPIWVRILWPKPQQKPDYMSSWVKYFISLVAKALKHCRFLNDLMCFYHSNHFFSSLFRLLSLTAECLRIGSGNVRPYLQITSSRNLVAFELWCQLSQLKLTENFKILNFITNSMDQTHLPWLSLHFCLQMLNNHFADLKHMLPNIMIANPKSKIKLCLRMIVSAFLTGNLDEFQISYLRMLRKNRHRKKQQVPETRTPDKSSKNYVDYRLKQTKDFLDKMKLEKVNQNESKNQNDQGNATYKRYLNRKTSYGGNSLHIACRQNDYKALGWLFEATKPNMADSFGYTPLIDSVRFQHVECVKSLIELSRKFDVRLDFEATVSTEKCYTALHYAVITGNLDIIRLLLENGGPHLLSIESIDGLIPEDLIEVDEMRKFISSIRYNQSENHLPHFETLAQQHRMEVAQIIKHYCRMVNCMLSNYLQAIKIDRFKIDIYIDETKPLDKQQVEEDLTQLLLAQFNQIFERPATEQEIDHLIDDLQIIINLPNYFRRFCSQLREQKIDFVTHLEFDQLEFQIKHYSLDVVRRIYA